VYVRVSHSHPPHKRWWEKSSFCTHCDDGDDDACNLQHKHKHHLFLFSLSYHSLLSLKPTMVNLFSLSPWLIWKLWAWRHRRSAVAGLSLNAALEVRANLQLPETLLTLSLVLVSFMMQVHTQHNITNNFFPPSTILLLHCESQPLYCVVSLLSLTPMKLQIWPHPMSFFSAFAYFLLFLKLNFSSSF